MKEEELYAIGTEGQAQTGEAGWKEGLLLLTSISIYGKVPTGGRVPTEDSIVTGDRFRIDGLWI